MDYLSQLQREFQQVLNQLTITTDMLYYLAGKGRILGRWLLRDSWRLENLYFLHSHLRNFKKLLKLTLSDKTGPADATSAILFVYNIFGFCPQILQGANLLARAIKAQVYMPDFLKGEVADHAWVPPDTEKRRASSTFIEGPASISTAAGAIPAVLKSATEESGGKITKWAALGFCWGYKVCLNRDCY